MQLSPDRKKTWYLVFFILLTSIILLPAYMAWEARTPDVTVMYIPNAPEGIVFIADPHIRQENIDTVRTVIARINRLKPALVLIGGDFTTPDEEDLSLQAVWAEIDAPVYAVLWESRLSGGNKRIRSVWEDSLGYGISPPLQGVFPGSALFTP